jgi:hypothetical protein
LSFNRSDNGNETQHKIFDLIQFGNSEDEEVMESGYDDEIEVLESNGTVTSHENNTITFSTEENWQGEELNKQTNFKKAGKNFSSHTNNFFPAKKDLISVLEDVGGKYLFYVRQTVLIIVY